MPKKEAKEATTLKCKHCNSKRLNKNGTQGNKQRYYCRNCKRTFREGKDKRLKYTEDFKMETIKWYLENTGIRSIERIMKVPDTTIIRWIKDLGTTVKSKLHSAADNIDESNVNKEDIEILEIDEVVTYVKKSLKTKMETQTKDKETSPSYGLLLIDNKIALLTLN